MAETISFQRGDVYDVEVTRLNDDGEGVTSVKGVTTFVPGTLPGEQVRVRITDVQRRFARAAVVEQLGLPSPTRVSPICSVFGTCGGCRYQHLAYGTQLQHKRNIVEQALRRMAKLPDIPVLPTLGMDAPWRYRNQVQVPLHWDKTQHRLVPGFFAAGSHEIVPTSVCHLEPMDMEKTVVSVTDLLNQGLGLEAEMVHHLIVRYSFTTGEQMVVLCLRSPVSGIAQVTESIHALNGVVSVAVTVQPKPFGPVWGRDVHILCGKPHLVEAVNGLEFLISPRSFFQVNTIQARSLYRKALDYAALTGEESVLDAYCGTGTIGLMLAGHAHRVIGIESVAPAVEDARRNASHNHIGNAAFHTGEVEKLLPRMVKGGERFDVAVLDPPRKGCDPAVLDSLLRTRPKRIVYVSCNHVTLARDLRLLADGGYEVREVQPVDMFPQTAHVECCSLLVSCPNHGRTEKTHSLSD